MLPGYVFFEIPTCEHHLVSEKDAGRVPLDVALQDVIKVDCILKLLRYLDGRWQLNGFDDQFARMLFEAGGNIGISQAFFDQGNRIRILDGFLKDYEGSISRVNRKRRVVEVKVDLHGKKVSMWLGYELVEVAKDRVPRKTKA